MTQSARKPVLVLNGPNLNLLGQRQPDIYGSTTLEDVRVLCDAAAARLGLELRFEQFNGEGELVTAIQAARVDASAIIINAAAYTHTSVAILDALLASELPVVEVHLSNIHRREEFRKHSFVSQAAVGVICGFGAKGYEMALDAVADVLKTQA